MDFGDRWRLKIGFGLIWLASHQIGGASDLPSQLEYQAAEMAKDCSIYQLLIKHTRSRIDEFVKNLQRHRQQLRDARSRLDQCGEGHGLAPSLNRDQRSVLLATLCPKLYQDWLAPSYRIHMVEQDLASQKQVLFEVRKLNRSTCAEVLKSADLRSSF